MSKTPLTPAELGKLDWIQQQVEAGTFYSLLGLDSRASRDDVESAYREYVRDWHPDRFFSRDAKASGEQIENNFVEVTRAYKTLRDVKKRAVYDADLRQQGVTVAAVGGVVRDERVGFEVQVGKSAGRTATFAPVEASGAEGARTPPASPASARRPAGPRPSAPPRQRRRNARAPRRNHLRNGRPRPPRLPACVARSRSSSRAPRPTSTPARRTSWPAASQKPRAHSTSRCATTRATRSIPDIFTKPS
jgi:curved DNA-binding protein CbpA